jgi:hypothetical protein
MRVGSQPSGTGFAAAPKMYQLCGTQNQFSDRLPEIVFHHRGRHDEYSEQVPYGVTSRLDARLIIYLCCEVTSPRPNQPINQPHTHTRARTRTLKRAHACAYGPARVRRLSSAGVQAESEATRLQNEELVRPGSAVLRADGMLALLLEGYSHDVETPRLLCATRPARAVLGFALRGS